MRVIRRRRTYARKPPQSTRINPGSAFAQGLMWFAPFNEACGTTIGDAMNGLPLTVQGSAGWSFAVTEPAMSFALSNQGCTAVIPPYLQLPFPITLVCKIRLLATRSTTGTHILALTATNNNTTPFRAAGITFRSAAPQAISLEWNNAGTFSSANGVYTPTVGVDVTLGGVFTGTNQYLYADGKLVYTGTVSGGNPTYTTPVLSCGGGAGNTSAAAIGFSWGGVWNIYTDANWHAAFAANPWQLFQPPRTYWIGIPAGATLTANVGTFAESGVAANLLRASKVAATVGTFAETGIAARLLYGRTVIATVGTFVETGRVANLLYSRTVVAAKGTFTQAGVAAGLLHGFRVIASAGAFTETGVAAILVANYPLIAAAGSFVETGRAANLLYGRTVVAAKGTFSESGIAARLLYGRTVIASVGAFTESGVAAGFLVGRRITAAPGSFTEAGIAAGLYRGRTVIATAGSFAETGVAANLQATHLLTATQGSFAETGVSAGLMKGRTVTASVGAFAETGLAAGLLYSRAIAAATGVFAETGVAANLRTTHILVAATGSFVEAGNAATLTKTSLRTLLAQAGAFSETGLAASLLTTRLLVGARGTFVESGLPASLLRTRTVIAAAGSFVEVGRAANLSHAFRVLAAPGAFVETGRAAVLFPTRILVARAGAFVEAGNEATLVYVALASNIQLFRRALAAKLHASASLASLVGDRIFYGVLPQTLDLARDGDAITYFVVSRPMDHHLSGLAGTATATVQISAWSDRGRDANRISEAVRNLLDGAPDVWGNDSTKILSCVKVSEVTLPEQPHAGSDQWVYQVASDYSIKHRIAIPA